MLADEAPVSRLRSRWKGVRGVAPRSPRRYHEQCAAEAAGTRRLSSRDMRFGPARMRVGKPVNCYPSQAPSEEGSGDSVRGAAGGTQGFSTSRGIELRRLAERTPVRLAHPPPSACTCAESRSTRATPSCTCGGSPTAPSGPDEETQRLPEPRSRSPRTSPAWPRTASTPSAPTPCPPRWLLDLASEHGLYVMVGLPWEEHVTFLDDRKRTRAIERARARDGALLRGPSGDPLLRDRQRDPGLDRALARQAADRALPEAALPRREGARTRARWSPTSTTRAPSTSSCRSSTSSASTSSSSRARSSRPTWRGCRTSPATGRWS